MRNHYADGVKAAAEVLGLKTAARRGFKIIKDAWRAGNHAEVDRLARIPGYTRPTPTGSYLKMLSSTDPKNLSAEGPVIAAVHAPRPGDSGGLFGTKFYDHRGAGTPTGLDAKVRAGNIPHESAVRIRSDNVPGLDMPMHRTAYFPEGTADAAVARGEVDRALAAERKVKDFVRGAEGHGLKLHDGHGANFSADGKFFDPIVSTMKPKGVNPDGSRQWGDPVSHVNPNWDKKTRIDPWPSYKRQVTQAYFGTRAPELLPDFAVGSPMRQELAQLRKLKAARKDFDQDRLDEIEAVLGL